MKFAILAPASTPRIADLTTAIRQATNHATDSLLSARVTSTNDPAIAARHDFVFYLHGGKTSAPLPALRPLVDDERALAIVQDLPSAATVPQPLSELNALALDGQDQSRLKLAAQIGLARLLAPRRQRKVFISYRRTDSEPIANELHDRLRRQRYEVFLDTVSVDFGVQVQRRVLDELIDADAVIILASPCLTDSRWVMDEIQLAQTTGMGLLIVAWPSTRRPGQPPPPVLASAFADSAVLRLDESHFAADGTWPGSTHQRVIDHLEANRVSFLCERMRNFHGLARHDLPTGLRVRRLANSFHTLNIVDQRGRRRGQLHTLPHLPTADVIAELAKDAPGLPAWYLFHEPDRKHKRTAALRWMLARAADRAAARLQLVGHPHESLATSMQPRRGGGAR